MFSGADNGSLFCRPARLTFRDLLLYFYFNKNILLLVLLYREHRSP